MPARSSCSSALPPPASPIPEEKRRSWVGARRLWALGFGFWAWNFGDFGPWDSGFGYNVLPVLDGHQKEQLNGLDQARVHRRGRYPGSHRLRGKEVGRLNGGAHQRSAFSPRARRHPRQRRWRRVPSVELLVRLLPNRPLRSVRRSPSNAVIRCRQCRWPPLVSAERVAGRARAVALGAPPGSP